MNRNGYPVEVLKFEPVLPHPTTLAYRDGFIAGKAGESARIPADHAQKWTTEFAWNNGYNAGARERAAEIATRHAIRVSNNGQKEK